MKTIKAGAKITVAFRAMPKTLYSQIRGKPYPAKMTFYLPKNYSPEKKFPLILWNSGGDGHKGTDLRYPLKLTRGMNVVCLTLPLFKRDLEPLKTDKSNYWSRMILNDRNTAATTWKCYKIMLEKFFSLVPNIDMEKTFMGGFSNGANVTALLLDRPRSEILVFFNHFFFMEGGTLFSRIKTLRKRDLLVLFGNRHDWGRKTEAVIGKNVKRLVSRSRARGVNCESFIGKGLGHVIAPVFTRRLKKWIRERI